MKKMTSRLIVIALTLTLVCGSVFVSNAASKPKNPRVTKSSVTWDCVYFGKYMQGTSSKKTKIKWRVLNVKDGKMLLLADKNLETLPYYSSYVKNGSWEGSNARAFCNDFFLKEAFSSKERAAMKKGWNGASEIANDKVFLLSLNEATNTKYGFSKSMDSFLPRGASNTKHIPKYYVYNMRKITYPDRWMLRNVEYGSVYTVSGGGSISAYYNVNEEKNCVRPAIVVKTSSKLWKKAGTVKKSKK